MLSFSLPALIPATTGSTNCLIIQAVAEIGLIISSFMACKFSYAGIIGATLSTSLILSYLTYELSPDFESCSHLWLLQLSVGLLYTILT